MRSPAAPDGLSAEEAAARLERIGRNRLEGRRREGSLRLLVRQFENPIILILAFASLLAFFLGDAVDAWIILAIILLSGLLGFWREHGAADAIEALRGLVRTEVEVRRESRIVSVPLEEIVPGDLVVLNAGDIVPGDALVLESKDLLVDEAVLTGEAYPVEKECGVVAEQTPLALRTNCLFTGTHVVSGTAEALVVHTGADDRARAHLEATEEDARADQIRAGAEPLRLHAHPRDGGVPGRDLRGQCRPRPGPLSTRSCSRSRWRSG